MEECLHKGENDSPDPLQEKSSLFWAFRINLRRVCLPIFQATKKQGCNVASCNLQDENPDCYARFQVIIRREIIFANSLWILTGIHF